MQKHRRVIQDTHFKDTGFPVDVFHFKCKHKETDTFCQEHCNPASFPDLLDEKNNKWYFNTSICEQTNVWFGGYQAIVRDMEVTRYNFYLDEMIKRHNRHIVEELRRKSKRPILIPKENVL